MNIFKDINLISITKGNCGIVFVKFSCPKIFKQSHKKMRPIDIVRRLIEKKHAYVMDDIQFIQEKV